MTALETVAHKLIKGLLEAKCFGENGEVQNRETAHKILDLPFLHVLVMDILGGTYCYASSGICERAQVTCRGWLDPDSMHSINLAFDPMSFQRILSELDRFSQGATQAQSGTLTFISDTEPEEHVYCSDYSFLIARSTDGENTYYAHFFYEEDQMDMINAYAAFDLQDLTDRQMETLGYLLNGISYQEIADRMEITYKTLEKHVRAVYEITGCQNQAALIDACSTV